MGKKSQKTEQKNITEVAFILDRSGSMGGLESDTIGGFNSLLNKQKEEDAGSVIVSTVLFDDKQEIIHDRLSVDKVPLLTNEQYYVRGCTSLLDTIGETIERISMAQRYAREEDRPNKTLFVITTDGLENASHKYNYKMVKELIESKKKVGWEFLFLGANIDAIEEAGKFGIDSSRAVNFNCDSEGTQLNYSVINSVVGKVRKCSSAMMMQTSLDSDWKSKIEEDYERRKK